MIYSSITGSGGYLPERVMTNAELEGMVDTSDQWIRERTGIRCRRIAADGETASDMAVAAALPAMRAAGVGADDIDLIVLATSTPDKVFPSTACLVQARLNIHGCAAFDVQAACSGFIYALGCADSFIRAGRARCALVIGSEAMSRILDWSDRGTCVLFGDGAGAMVLQASDAPGVYSTHLHADGAYGDLLHVPAGVTKSAAAPTAEPVIEMRGNEVFKMAVRTLGRIVDETLAFNRMSRADVDWLVPHQANTRIIAAMARKLELDMAHVVLTIAEHGNTSAASIPLAFDAAVRDGRIKPGQTVLMEAFGGGFTWGSALVKTSGHAA